MVFVTGRCEENSQPLEKSLSCFDAACRLPCRFPPCSGHGTRHQSKLSLSLGARSSCFAVTGLQIYNTSIASWTKFGKVRAGARVTRGHRYQPARDRSCPSQSDKSSLYAREHVGLFDQTHLPIGPSTVIVSCSLEQSSPRHPSNQSGSSSRGGMGKK